MKKTLLTTSLAIIGSFVIGADVLAAPGVVYKRRMDVPTVPSSIVTKVKNLPWVQVKDVPNTIKLHKPTLELEKDCDGVNYRVWRISRDISTSSTHPSLANYSPYYRTVFESRTATSVKWYIYPSKTGHGGEMVPMPYICRGNDLVVMSSTMNEYSGQYSATYSLIRDTHFNLASEWTKPSQSYTYTSAIEHALNAATLHLFLEPKIHQIPGVLLVKDGKISGDSRPVTFDQKSFSHQHTVPHYRDLTQVMSSGTEIISLFYRIPDGYAVLEGVKQNGTTTEAIYIIKNGEARYTKHDSKTTPENLALIGEKIFKLERSYLYLGKNGVNMSGGLLLFDTQKPTLVHGIASTAGIPENRFQLKATTLWETDAQIYTRYLLTERATGKQQYWEATVNKK